MYICISVSYASQNSNNSITNQYFNAFFSDYVITPNITCKYFSKSFKNNLSPIYWPLDASFDMFCNFLAFFMIFAWPLFKPTTLLLRNHPIYIYIYIYIIPLIFRKILSHPWPLYEQRLQSCDRFCKRNWIFQFCFCQN